MIGIIWGILLRIEGSNNWYEKVMYRGSSIPLVSADTLVDDKPSHDNFNIRAAADIFHLYKLKPKSYFSKTRKNAEKVTIL